MNTILKSKVSAEFRPTYNVELNHKEIRTGEHRGKHQVLIRVTVNKRHTRHGTGIYVIKKDFNKAAKFGAWIRGRPDWNKIIEDKINELKRGTEGVKTDAPDFFTFAYDFIRRYNNDRQGYTYDNYTGKLKRLTEYAGSVLPFRALTVEFIRKYATYLRVDLGNKPNTVASHMSKIRAIINQAVKEDIIDERQNPFRKFSIDKERTFKNRLTLDELRAINALELKAGTRKYMARDIFMLSLYMMGVRVGDMVSLKVGDRDGNTVTIHTGKSKKTKRIELVRPAVDIWDRSAAGKKRDDYLFPFLESTRNKQLHRKKDSANSFIRNELKEIAKEAGVTTNLTMHISRHTWTQIAMEKGALPRDVQQALGHSSLATTEAYLGDFRGSRVDELNKDLFND